MIAQPVAGREQSVAASPADKLAERGDLGLSLHERLAFCDSLDRPFQERGDLATVAAQGHQPQDAPVEQP